MDDYVVLIPAYKPDERLVTLAGELISMNIRLFVVDDGSGSEFSNIFNSLRSSGVDVFVHDINRGKGAALKTGIGNLKDNKEIKGIITADADGQHTSADIKAAIDMQRTHPDALVIGVRKFGGKVPLRSRIGNTITRGVFHYITGNKVSDTQTGLRGLPSNLFDRLCELEGERYEFEMNMLLKAGDWGADIIELPIRTVYIDNNKSSHFDSIKDSWRIYKQIVIYCASSIFSYLVDYGLYILLGIIGFKYLAYRYIIARVSSGIVNYLINRHMVFKQGSSSSAVKYFMLAILLTIIGSYAISWLQKAGIGGLIAKPLVDIPLFFIGFYVQKFTVFKSKEN
jgi:putative flippase GtrA